MRVVVSAFEPFGGKTVNRSRELMDKLEVQVERFVLPVRFSKLEAAVEAVAATRPELWLILGESSQAEGLVLEALAVNEISARLPDNDGAQPQGQLVEPGPLARETAVDLASRLARLEALGVPARRSTDAGRFACNAAYYLALGRLQPERVLFVHVPSEPARCAEELLLRGLEAILSG